MICGEEDVFFEDWCIVIVGGFLSLKDLCHWDVAMSSQRKKWLNALSNVKIAGINGYEHRCNESVRWLISRRIQHVSNITYSRKFIGICSKTFTGARVLSNLTSFESYSCSDSILKTLKVNCPHLEKVCIEVCTQTGSLGEVSSFSAAARMVQNLQSLREFKYTRDTAEQISPVDIHESSTGLLLSLSQFCPLLEILDLGKYNDEGLAELVAGCPKLHTLTINADTYEVSLAGYRALGHSRSITTLNITACASIDINAALHAMADEGMPIITLDLFSAYDETVEFGDQGISVVARFAQTLQHLSIIDLSFNNRDEGLHALSQCHNLRSIEVRNKEDDDEQAITGSFLFHISIGCPLLEKVTIDRIVPVDRVEDTFVNFKPFFERCPKLKEFHVYIHTDEEVKALAQHCPLMECIQIGSDIIDQEHSEITDASLVAIAQGLRFLTDIEVNSTQCTDAGLLALAKGNLSSMKRVYISHGAWEQGYPNLITEEGIRELHTGIQKVLKKLYIQCCDYNRYFSLQY